MMISVVVPDGVIISEMELERLVEQYGDGLLRTCLLYLKDYGLAEDAVQETFLRAFRNYHKFEGRSSEKTWLTAIAINVCRTMLRSPWRRRNVGEEALLLLQAEDPDLPDPTVARAVMQLPGDQRAVVILYYVQEMKIRDQLDRMGEIEHIQESISRALGKRQIGELEPSELVLTMPRQCNQRT